MAGMMCGGPSNIKAADDEVMEICNKIRESVESKAGKKFSEFVPSSYMTQVVAGTNYFIKVRVGEDGFVHLRVFKSLPHAGGTLELHSMQADKAEGDELVYF